MQNAILEWFPYLKVKLAFFRACSEAGIEAEKLRSHWRSRRL